MDLEHLNKHQIVLLTLLVSFVTSIATGIVTVSLMNQAPPSISRTINQIVERTVQTVAAPALPATVTQHTVVVKDDDLAAQSIAAVQKAIIRVVDAKDPEVLLARGVVIDKSGTALTDRVALVASGATGFEAFLASGEKVSATLRPGQSTTTDTVVLDLAVGTSTGFAPVALADPAKVKLGSSVIRIGGTGADTVGVGVVASSPHNGLIQSSVLSSTPGSVLLTLFGEVAGIMTGGSAEAGADYYTTPTVPPAAPSPVKKTSS